MSDPKIFVAGHKGMVGSSLARLLKKEDVEIITKDKNDLNLLNQENVKNFFKNEKIDQVYLAAAKVGGIYANNTYPVDFIYENLMIQNNIIHSAFLNGVKKLLFLGSSCIYPKNANQPMKEEELLSGKLEPTNEPYAIAKIAGVKMCEYYNKQYNTNFKSLMPTNTFGPNDNYDLNTSHFLPALIRKIYEAKINKKNYINIWGNGKTKRELIYVDDLAEAAVYFLFKKTNYFLINIGNQKDFTIKQYAQKIMKIFNIKLKIKYIKKDLKGTSRKLLDCSIAKKLGWAAKVKIDHVLEVSIKDFIKNYKNYKN